MTAPSASAAVAMNLNGIFYSDFLKRTFPDGAPMYTPVDRQCIEETVSELRSKPTTDRRPGLLLGKIQSGKTRTFIGATALAFDNGFDVAVVLTKNSEALVSQTCKRLTSEFSRFVKAKSVVIHDVMKLPNPVPKFILQQKLLVVAKKETANINRLIALLTGPDSPFKSKRVLLIDDEADNASVGYKAAKGAPVTMASIADQINTLRAGLTNPAFLQVTATPYALFLQNEGAAINGTEKLSLRPAFTKLVPVHDAYVGGEFYFEKSLEKDHPASFMFSPIAGEELVALKKQPNRNGFKIETDCLTSSKVAGLRAALVGFIVGGCLRRLQMEQAGASPEHFSFLLHTEASKGAHSWQQQLVERMVEDLSTKAGAGDFTLLDPLLRTAYDDLSRSVTASALFLPDFDAVKALVTVALTQDWVHIAKVNSDQDVTGMLDETGQLNLAAPLNIFIGGQYLDRGVTIERLIGFFYGRAPKKYQQDTVLQHSRMYGARPKADCAVTRFHTAADIYAAMASMHRSDTALRERIEAGDVETSLHFIERDARGLIVPCGVAKIRASNQITVRPHDKLLPNGFNTVSASALNRITAKVDKKLETAFFLASPQREPFTVELDFALGLLDDLKDAFTEFLPGMEDSWVIEDYRALLSHLSRNAKDAAQRGKVGLLIRTDRNRPRQEQQPLDTPDHPVNDLRPARAYAEHAPVLCLFKQEGKAEQGWKEAQFWWPMLVSPRSAGTLLYAQGTPEIPEEEDDGDTEPAPVSDVVSV